MATELGAEPTRFLSTVQIGITSIAMLSGIVGEATLAPPLAANIWSAWGATTQAAGYLATAVVVAVVTYFSIVVGELVPKRIGQMHAERVARFVARPIQLLAIASKPFVWLLTSSTRILLRLLGVDDLRAQARLPKRRFTRSCTRDRPPESSRRRSARWSSNLFRLDDRSIATLMTPRADIASLDVDARPDEVIETMEAAPHSRYPVVRGDRQDVIGVVSARALLLALLRGAAARPRETGQGPDVRA